MSLSGFLIYFITHALMFATVVLLPSFVACWLVWPFHVPTSGGRPSVGRATAPRVMCEVAHGPPPNAHACVLHSCGNGHLGCLNPNHLRWGSHLENSADSLRHKRHGKKGL